MRNTRRQCCNAMWAYRKWPADKIQPSLPVDFGQMTVFDGDKRKPLLCRASSAHCHFTERSSIEFAHNKDHQQVWPESQLAQSHQIHDT